MSGRLSDILNAGSDFLTSNGILNPCIDSERLLEYVLDLDRIELYIDVNREIDEQKIERFKSLIKRRGNGEPIQYLLGDVDFFGNAFYVKEGVFIPRPETEVLVEKVIKLFSSKENLKVVDVGTGCGNIAISIALKFPKSFIYAIDISENALRIARLNAKKHGVSERIEFLNSDLFHTLSSLKLEKKIDLIVSDPPYIKRKDIESLPVEVKGYEPVESYDGGEDGLEFIVRLIEDSPYFLKQNGILAFEFGFDEKDSVCQLFDEYDFYSSVGIVKDYSGNDRIAIASCERL